MAEVTEQQAHRIMVQMALQTLEAVAEVAEANLQAQREEMAVQAVVA